MASTSCDPLPLVPTHCLVVSRGRLYLCPLNGKRIDACVAIKDLILTSTSDTLSEKEEEESHTVTDAGNAVEVTAAPAMQWTVVTSLSYGEAGVVEHRSTETWLVALRVKEWKTEQRYLLYVLRGLHQLTRKVLQGVVTSRDSNRMERTVPPAFSSSSWTASEGVVHRGVRTATRDSQSANQSSYVLPFALTHAQRWPPIATLPVSVARSVSHTLDAISNIANVALHRLFSCSSTAAAASCSSLEESHSVHGEPNRRSVGAEEQAILHFLNATDEETKLCGHVPQMAKEDDRRRRKQNMVTERSAAVAASSVPTTHSSSSSSSSTAETDTGAKPTKATTVMTARPQESSSQPVYPLNVGNTTHALTEAPPSKENEATEEVSSKQRVEGRDGGSDALHSIRAANPTTTTTPTASFTSTSSFCSSSATSSTGASSVTHPALATQSAGPAESPAAFSSGALALPILPHAGVERLLRDVEQHTAFIEWLTCQTLRSIEKSLEREASLSSCGGTMGTSAEECAFAVTTTRTADARERNPVDLREERDTVHVKGSRPVEPQPPVPLKMPAPRRVAPSPSPPRSSPLSADRRVHSFKTMDTSSQMLRNRLQRNAESAW